MAWGYWPGCYRPKVGLGVQAWLLEDPGWPGGTGLAASGPMLAWGTGPAATGPRLAFRIASGYWPGCCSPHGGYWPGCYSPQECLGVLACLLQAQAWPGVLAWLLQAPGWPGGTCLAATAHSYRGFLPGCYSPQGVLVWLLQAPGWLGGTSPAATGPRLA